MPNEHADIMKDVDQAYRAVDDLRVILGGEDTPVDEVLASARRVRSYAEGLVDLSVRHGLPGLAEPVRRRLIDERNPGLLAAVAAVQGAAWDICRAYNEGGDPHVFRPRSDWAEALERLSAARDDLAVVVVADDDAIGQHACRRFMAGANHTLVRREIVDRWGETLTVQGVEHKAKAFASRHGIVLPKGKTGRPRKQENPK